MAQSGQISRNGDQVVHKPLETDYSLRTTGPLTSPERMDSGPSQKGPIVSPSVERGPPLHCKKINYKLPNWSTSSGERKDPLYRGKGSIKRPQVLIDGTFLDQNNFAVVPDLWTNNIEFWRKVNFNKTEPFTLTQQAVQLSRGTIG